MYLGIDLGTSNSAVVGNDGTSQRLFKTAEGTDVLPSVIHLDKRGHRFVGSRAYDRIFTAPDNVAQGFKRSMGTSTPINFAGQTWTPEECSAEILKTLVAQARLEGGDAPIEGAVITVPAAFNQMQSEATIRAAAMAGLDRVALLQEPVAAAMASIARSANKNGMFLIYDLGGGTFDVALVQSTGGAVNVVAHEGINMLGGRDFDRMLFEEHVRPWLMANFDLPADFPRDPKLKRLMGIARHAVEKAKIELSSADRATVFAGDEDIRATDRSGADIYISVEITRANIEALVAERIAESVALCRKTLTDNGLTNEDIDRVVLIGGPSKMPVVRDMVPRELGIRAEADIDPMTAVAVGAAIFAESREWTEAGSRRKSTRQHEEVRGAVSVALDYQSRVSAASTRLRVTLGDDAPAGCTLEVSDENGNSTGKMPIEGRVTATLDLDRRGENRFRIVVCDPSGRPIEDATREITVIRTDASAAAIPATYTLALKVVAGQVGYEKNVLEALLKKGTPLPASGTTSVRAGKSLRGGDADAIRMEFFQQSPGIDDPALNLCIGDFVLDARQDLDHGERLERGAELNIQWNMDDNGLLSFSVEVPDLGRVIDGRNLYVPEARHKNFEGEKGAEIADALLAQAEKDVDGAEEALGASARSDIEGLRKRVERQHLALAQSTDADTHRAVSEEARKLRQDIALLKHRPEHRAAATAQKLDDVEEEFDGAREYAKVIEADRFDRLGATARRSLRSNDFDDAARAVDEMESIAHALRSRSPEFMIGLFTYLAQSKHLAIDDRIHDRLVAEGTTAVRGGDIDELRVVVSAMLQNCVLPGAGDNDIAALADLMRA
jgi:molecular chaperone DnaK